MRRRPPCYVDGLRPLILLTIATLLGCATAPPPLETQSRDPNVVPDQLDKRDVVEGASKAKPAVAACFDRYRVQGMASVSFAIPNDGHPTNVTVAGDFAGTPTGQCVAEAVANTARFRPHTGMTQSIVYPFILR